MSEGYGTYHLDVCAEPDCDQPRAKHGFQNGRQRYKRYCSHHYGNLHDRTRAEQRKRNPHRLTYEERTITKLRKDACERCGWSEARCDLHRIITSSPAVLCPGGGLYLLHAYVLTAIRGHRTGDADDLRDLPGQGPRRPRDRWWHLRLFSGLPGTGAITAKALRAAGGVAAP